MHNVIPTESLQRHFTVNSKRPRLTSLNHHVTKSRLTVTFRSTIPVRCCGSKTHETFLSVSYLLGRKLPSCPASLPSEEITYVGLCISSNLHFSWAGGVVLAGTRQKMHEPGLKCPLKFLSLPGLKCPLKFRSLPGLKYPLKFPSLPGLKCPLQFPSLPGLKCPLKFPFLPGLKYPLKFPSLPGLKYPLRFPSLPGLKCHLKFPSLPGLKCPLKFPSLQPFINVGFAGYDVLKQVQLQTYSV